MGENSNNYPPGSKSKALQLGVHFFLLYLIRISFLSAETFFLFWWLVVDGWRLFGSSNHLILIWYILLVYMYIFSYSDNFRQNSCGFNFVIKLNFFLTIFKITLLGWFFAKWSPTSRSRGYFWDQISGLIFFQKKF